MTLTEFLLARIAEDERDGRWVAEHYDRPSNFTVETTDIESNPVIMVSHERWLAECEAKRRIVDLNGKIAERSQPRAAVIETLCILASVYSDHPDYRQEWKP